LHTERHLAGNWNNFGRQQVANDLGCVQVVINEDNITDIQAYYEGPSETPYEGGLFKMKLVFGPDFPNAPPKGQS